jgi:hypothetical protein
MTDLWAFLTSWAFVGFAFAVAVAIGVGVMSMTPPDFVIARWCFSIGATLALFKTALWLVSPRQSPYLIVLAFFSFGIVGAGWLLSIHYVNSRVAMRNPTIVRTEDHPTNTVPSCDLNIDSQIIARLFGETMKAPPPDVGMEARFKYKELFYEWSVTIAPNQEISEVSITIDHLKFDDRISAIPDATTVSDLKPRWVSGFEENRKPDHFAKTFRFASLSKERTARIVVRRPVNQLALNNNSLGEPDIIRIADSVAKSCHMEIPKSDRGDDAKRLSVHLAALAKWDGGRGDGGSMPIKADSGEFPKVGYAMPRIEVRCKNEPCDQMIMGQLEVKWGGTQQPKQRP